MDWESWFLTGTNAVLAISAIASALYARQAVVHQRDAMKRKAPIIEARMPGRWSANKEWLEWAITVRNLEPVSVRITQARCIPRNGLIVSDAEAHEEIPGAFGERRPRSDLVGSREVTLNRLVGPIGALRSESGYSPSGSEWLTVVTKGVSNIDEIKFSWEWTDGHRD